MGKFHGVGVVLRQNNPPPFMGLPTAHLIPKFLIGGNFPIQKNVYHPLHCAQGTDQNGPKDPIMGGPIMGGFYNGKVTNCSRFNFPFDPGAKVRLRGEHWGGYHFKKTGWFLGKRIPSTRSDAFNFCSVFKRQYMKTCCYFSAGVPLSVVPGWYGLLGKNGTS